jgi:hypothetical protein
MRNRNLIEVDDVTALLSCRNDRAFSLATLSIRPALFSSSSGHDTAPILETIVFSAAASELTGESKRSPINGQSSPLGRMPLCISSQVT